MTRDVITVSIAEVECERIFNVAETLYNHRKSYNSKIFFAYMMIRFHDQNVNAQTKLNANFLTKKDKIIQDMKEKMKKRMNKLKDVYDKLYISDDDEEKVVRKTTIRTFTTIRFYVIRFLCDVYLIKIQKEKKRNLNAKKSIFTQQE